MSNQESKLPIVFVTQTLLLRSTFKNKNNVHSIISSFNIFIPKLKTKALVSDKKKVHFSVRVVVSTEKFSILI